MSPWTAEQRRSYDRARYAANRDAINARRREAYMPRDRSHDADYVPADIAAIGRLWHLGRGRTDQWGWDCASCDDYAGDYRRKHLAYRALIAHRARRHALSPPQ